MTSRQGKITLQLTQWVGGTIIVLMFVFIIADYLVQVRHLRAQQESVAVRGAEGLKTYLERGTALEEARESLREIGAFSDYTESQDRGFVVFDVDGEPIVYTSGTLPTNPEERARLSKMPSRPMEVRRLTLSNSAVVAAVSTFETKSDPASQGVLAYVVLVELQEQLALKSWATRAVMVLLMIIATMLAVRIPVKKFVVAPIDGLFLAAYAASKDDFRKLPACPVDNEFTELYDMFGRLLGHLSDTRIGESLEVAEGELSDMEKPVE